MNPRNIASELQRLGFVAPLTPAQAHNYYSGGHFCKDAVLPDATVMAILEQRRHQHLDAEVTLKRAQQAADAAWLQALGIEPL